MKMYTNRETTPLNFHAFFRFGVIPLFLINCFIILNEAYTSMYFSRYFQTGSYWGIDMFFCSVLSILLVAAFIGFFSWKAYAWYCTIAMLIINSVYRLIICFMVGFYLKKLSPSIFMVVLFVLIGLYYYKRRDLFLTSKMDLAKQVYTPPRGYTSQANTYQPPVNGPYSATNSFGQASTSYHSGAFSPYTSSPTSNIPVPNPVQVSSNQANGIQQPSSNVSANNPNAVTTGLSQPEFCRHCGGAVAPNTKFCIYCGKMLY